MDGIALARVTFLRLLVAKKSSRVDLSLVIRVVLSISCFKLKLERILFMSFAELEEDASRKSTLKSPVINVFPYSQHLQAQEPLEKDSGNQIVTKVYKKYQIKFLLPWVKVTPAVVY